MARFPNQRRWVFLKQRVGREDADAAGDGLRDEHPVARVARAGRQRSGARTSPTIAPVWARQPSQSPGEATTVGRTSAIGTPRRVTAGVKSLMTIRDVALWCLAAFFVAGGVNHFLKADFYLSMMPPWVPAHVLLVQVSGVFEVLGGIGVLVPATRSLAGWGLIAVGCGGPRGRRRQPGIKRNCAMRTGQVWLLTTPSRLT